MKEQVISFETAKLAKEKGFEESTGLLCVRVETDSNNSNIWEYAGAIELTLIKQNKLPYPHRENGCITQSLLQKWLREEHNISVSIETGWHAAKHIFEIYIWQDHLDTWVDKVFSTYEEALEEGLLNALNYIKK